MVYIDYNNGNIINSFIVNGLYQVKYYDFPLMNSLLFMQFQDTNMDDMFSIQFVDLLNISNNHTGYESSQAIGHMGNFYDPYSNTFIHTSIIERIIDVPPNLYNY